MIIVIQCAAKKNPKAGHLRRRDAKDVLFVADPAMTPPSESCVYARPDDIADSGVSWRAKLLTYNGTPSDNPLELLPAWRLYGNKTYAALVDCYGLDQVYILSAGWGLIAANFLTPNYDITFSPGAQRYKRRRKNDTYKDFCMLPNDTVDPVVFLGGHDYLSLFCTLTDQVEGQRHIFYNSANIPELPGCVLKRFNTTTRTNWHYECAKSLLDGKIGVD